MPPMKKVKRKPKCRPTPPPPAPPPDQRAPDVDWWPAFLRKASEAGSSAPSNIDEAFKYYFRISKWTFEYICSLVRMDLVSRPPSGLINIEGRLLSVEKQVAIAIRRLATGDSQVSVGASFGVGQSTVSQVTWRFIESMEDQARCHLKWPDVDRTEEIKKQLLSISGLPNCCGAIDATHIVMTLPAVESSEDWHDPEQNYSMLLQGVVDHELRFLDIVTGWPGGMSCSRLLKFSGFFKLCQAGSRLNGPVKVSSENEQIREFIAGGASYPLLPWLLTPCVPPLSAAAAAYNTRHAALCSLSARALTRLKGCWRILHKVMWRPDKQKLPSIIVVCCLLHNIMIDLEDAPRADALLPEPYCHDAGYKAHNCQQVDPDGKAARDALVRHLHNCEALRKQG